MAHQWLHCARRSLQRYRISRNHAPPMPERADRTTAAISRSVLGDRPPVASGKTVCPALLPRAESRCAGPAVCLRESGRFWMSEIIHSRSGSRQIQHLAEFMHYQIANILRHSDARFASGRLRLARRNIAARRDAPPFALIERRL